MLETSAVCQHQSVLLQSMQSLSATLNAVGGKKSVSAIQQGLIHTHLGRPRAGRVISRLICVFLQLGHLSWQTRWHLACVLFCRRTYTARGVIDGFELLHELLTDVVEDLLGKVSRETQSGIASSAAATAEAWMMVTSLTTEPCRDNALGEQCCTYDGDYPK